eukprot:957847-Lingulodinium_polyedra.AAC.1
MVCVARFRPSDGQVNDDAFAFGARVPAGTRGSPGFFGARAIAGQPAQNHPLSLARAISTSI